MSILVIAEHVDVPRSLVIAAAVINAANVLEILQSMHVLHGRDDGLLPDRKHLADEALDFRTDHLRPADKPQLQRVIGTQLGADYRITLEEAGERGEHLHIEYDPPARKRRHPLPSKEIH